MRTFSIFQTFQQVKHIFRALQGYYVLLREIHQLGKDQHQNRKLTVPRTLKQTLPPLDQYALEIRKQIYRGRQTSPLPDNTIIQVREQIVLSSVYEQIPAIHQLEQEPRDLQVKLKVTLKFPL